MTVPTVPAPYLVVREAHFSLRLLEADLHSPSAAGRPRQRFERGALGTEDRVGAEFVWLFDGAAHHKPPLEALLERGVERQPQPLVQARAFRALSGRDALPAFLGFLARKLSSTQAIQHRADAMLVEAGPHT